MKPETGTCKLCLKENVKLSESHIIPESLYDSIYEGKHILKNLSTIEEFTKKISQKGIKERLLCGDCEKLLNENYEKYGRFALNNMKMETIGVDKRKVVGLDYKKFKLFLLSILWRASVSKHLAFQNVSLGPHEEKIRGMILNNDAGKYDKYGIFFIEMITDGKRNIEMIVCPTMMKIDGATIYKGIWGGFMWLYFISPHGFKDFKENILMKEDGTALISRKSLMEIEYIKSWAKELQKMGRI